MNTNFTKVFENVVTDIIDIYQNNSDKILKLNNSNHASADIMYLYIHYHCIYEMKNINIDIYVLYREKYILRKKTTMLTR